MRDNTRTIVTAADHTYFGSLINLIGSVFRYFRQVDLIMVYDLGLTRIERFILQGIKKTELCQVPVFCEHCLELQTYAWKTAAIHKAVGRGGAILWLDAGTELRRGIADLFNTIERDGYLFVVTPFDQPHCKIGSLTRESSIRLMGAEPEQVHNELMVCAGLQGYHSNNNYARKITGQAMRWAANRNIIAGSRKNHRHDQSIYSVLRILNSMKAEYWLIYLPKMDKYPFLIPAKREGTVEEHEVARCRKEMTPYIITNRLDRAFWHKRWIVFSNKVLLRKSLLFLFMGWAKKYEILRRTGISGLLSRVKGKNNSPGRRIKKGNTQ